MLNTRNGIHVLYAWHYFKQENTKLESRRARVEPYRAAVKLPENVPTRALSNVN